MEVIGFENQFWQDIPRQDNPALDNPKVECVMITKYWNVGPGPTQGFVVIHVHPKKDVERRGIFWNYEDATLFAEALAQKLSGKEVTNGVG